LTCQQSIPKVVMIPQGELDSLRRQLEAMKKCGVCGQSISLAENGHPLPCDTCLKYMEQTAIEHFQDEVARLKGVICEVFSVDPSMAEGGCDVISSTIALWSKECRLTVVNTLREAAEAAEENDNG